MEITEKYHLSRAGRYAYRKSKKGNALFEVRSRCSFANYSIFATKMERYVSLKSLLNKGNKRILLNG
ncbi:hypothetical protein [Capnocytophaga leadbetteri]|uniref:hypothetical protein n=1 Tax=Capnocytophaga leadbetteri TaxID=327575 RepID=UPI003C7899CA